MTAQLQANAETVNAINQTIGGVAAMHAADDFGYGPARASKADAACLAASRRVIHFENRSFFPVEFVNGAVLGAVVAAGIGLTQVGLATAGMVVAFIVYVDALVQALTLIADLIGETQQARVALARLDESTSRVDDGLEQAIHACLERLAADRALVVIAHQPATIARSDQVFTLQDGRLAPLDAVST